jgi:hypothetical protein
MADANQDAAKVAEDRRKAREATNKANADLLKDQKEERAKLNAEADKRMSESKPTPTQEENDLARLGSPVLEKEPDGSGPDPHNLPLGAVAPGATVKRDVAANQPAGTYKTRESDTQKK